MGSKPNKPSGGNGKKKKVSPEIDDGVQLTIEHVFPDDLPTLFSNHAAVQFDRHEFHLSFFSIWPPLALGTPEERKEKLEQIGTVKANCVAHIVIPLTRMPEVAGIILNNLKKNMPDEFEELLNHLKNEPESKHSDE